MLLNNNKKVFYRLLTSYIMISAIPLLIMGAVFYYFNVVDLKKKIEENNISKLEQATERIDITLKEIKDIAMRISDSSNSYSAMSNDVLLNAEKSSYMQIVDRLQAFKDNIPVVDDVLLYERGNEFVYLTSGRHHYSEFEDKIKSDVNWTQISFFKKLNTISAPLIKKVNPIDTYQTEGNGKLAYMFPVPYLSTITQGAVAFIINEADFFSMIDDFVGDFNGFTYVFDNKNNVLTSRNNGITDIDTAAVEKSVKLFKGTGVHNIVLNKRLFIALRSVSKETGWSYVTVIPETEFFSRVYLMRNILLVTITVLVAFGLFSALYMSIRNYKPIKTLLNYITNQEPHLINEKFNNEFDIIRSTFDTTIQKNNELSSQMNAQRPMVKDQLLLKLVRGKIKDIQKLDYHMKLSNVQLEGSFYFTVVLSINSLNTSLEIIDKAMKLVEDFSFQGGRGYGVELAHNRNIAVCICIKDNNADIKAVQYAVVKGIDTLMEENLGWKPIIGIGNPYSDILKINTSYLEASAALYENLANYKSNIHFYCDMDHSSRQVQWYPITEQALFIQSLKQGDKDVALNALETIIERLAQKVNSYQMIRCLCFDIINSIIKAANQMGFGSMDLEIKGLLEFSNLEDFKRRASAFTIEFCKHLEKFRENKRSVLKKNIIKFVKDNFNDSNISLESVADKFEISVTHLSRLFKEETGVNFIDYITGLRIDKVKFELKTTNKPIKDIVKEVGYIDPASFVRKFKSLEGITPGKYRELLD